MKGKAGAARHRLHGFLGRATCGGHTLLQGAVMAGIAVLLQIPWIRNC